MAFMLRRKSFWFKFIIVGAIFWITVVLIHFSSKKELELTEDDFNDRFSEFLVDSRRDVNQKEVAPVEPENVVETKHFSQKNKIIKDNKKIETKTDDDDTSHKKPGDMGRPVVLPSNVSAEVKKLIDEGWTKNAFNEYVSNMISIRRELPDPR